MYSYVSSGHSWVNLEKWYGQIHGVEQGVDYETQVGTRTNVTEGCDRIERCFLKISNIQI